MARDKMPAMNPRSSSSAAFDSGEEDGDLEDVVDRDRRRRS